MDHVAIMKKSWNLTSKILSGEKTIETRWYKNRSKPWNSVNPGEKIYFKDSGEPVSVKATVSKVEQYEDLNNAKIAELLKKYGERDLGTTAISEEILEYVNGKSYAIIIHLKNPEEIESFEIDKKGFGSMSAWICVDDINLIKKTR